MVTCKIFLLTSFKKYDYGLIDFYSFNIFQSTVILILFAAQILTLIRGVAQFCAGHDYINFPTFYY